MCLVDGLPMGYDHDLFRAAWQQSQLKQCKESMPAKSAVVIIDYAENYSFVTHTVSL